MDLIITERGRTQAAYLQGEEWTDYGTLESNLDGLRRYLARAKEEESRQGIVRIDGNRIAIDFVSGAGIIYSQMFIDYNQTDHEQLISELSSIYPMADQ